MNSNQSKAAFLKKLIEIVICILKIEKRDKEIPEFERLLDAIHRLESEIKEGSREFLVDWFDNEVEIDYLKKIEKLNIDFQSYSGICEVNDEIIEEFILWKIRS